MKYYHKQYQLDFDILQEEFDDNYEDYSDWLEELDIWDTDTIEAQEYSWDVVPEGLSSIIEDNDFEDEDEEEFDD